MSSSSRTHQEGKLASYCQAVNYLLATNATDNVIAEDDLEIMNFRQPAGLSAVEYVQALWTEALRCGLVYDE